MTTVTVPARVHLAGNPSDGYGGAVLSTVVPQLAATVSVRPAGRFSVSGPDRSWPSLTALADDTARHGHDGGDRLVTAALVTLHRLLPGTLDRPALAVEWRTTIPRSVGLGGSSAIVVATMRAALDAWHYQLPDHELAEAALAAETDELGIAAGLADRVVQTTRGTVLTDNRTPAPTVTPVELAAGTSVTVTVAWSAAAAAPSGEYHRRLRARFGAGDAEVVDAMARLADLAQDAAGALTGGDLPALALALDSSLRIREVLGDVPAAAIDPVPALREAGASVNFAGSGGALVIIDGDAPPGWDSLVLELGRR